MEIDLPGGARKRVWIKKNLFLGLEVDQVDLPSEKVLINKGSRGDRPLDRPPEVDLDRPLDRPPEVDLDRPPQGRSTFAEVDHPQNPPCELTFGGVDRPDRPKCPNFKLEKFEKKFREGDRVKILQSGSFYGKEVFVLGNTRSGRVLVQGKGWVVDKVFDRSELKLIERSGE